MPIAFDIRACDKPDTLRPDRNQGSTAGGQGMPRRDHAADHPPCRAAHCHSLRLQRTLPRHACSISPMNSATKRVVGRSYSCSAGADLLQPTAIEHADAIAHHQRLVLVVRHVDDRDAESAVQMLDLDLHLLAQLLVEGAERLVHQQQRRLEHDGAGDRDALLLSARELSRIALRRSRASSTSFSTVVDARGGSRSRGMPRISQRKRDIARHRHVRETAHSSETPCRCRAYRAAAGRSACPTAGSRRRVGCVRPAIICRVVVLPEPEGPSRLEELALASCSETSSTAATLP